MAIQKELAKRFLRLFATVTPPPLTNAAGSLSRRGYVSAPDAASRGFFQRFLQRRAINQASFAPAKIPQFMAMPLGEDLREKLKDTGFAGMENNRPADPDSGGGGMTAETLKRMLRVARVEMVKERLRSAAESAAVTYSEYRRICVDACKSESQGLEMAKLLDESSNVVVWGDVVFLHPQQLAKSFETLLCESAGLPNDPRKKELDRMEGLKAQIDGQAQLLVKRELYFGLALMVAQTVGFVRLTFWELSWDVMEPICFFVASLHCALGYAFFLCTSTEPSFEGYFRRRFGVKQAKLMKERGFDLAKYESLRKVFYPPTLGLFGGVEEEIRNGVSKY